jgi:hypothetical protein
MTETLVEPLTSSPLRGLVRQRLSSRVDRALVFLSPGGDDRVAHPWGTTACAYRRPSLAMVRRKAFDRVCWVSLVEHADTVDVEERALDGKVRGSIQRSVTWRVVDPVVATRGHLSVGEAHKWIKYDLNGRTSEVAGQQGVPVDTDFAVREAGIAYQVRSSAPTPLQPSAPAYPTEPVVPSSWGEDRNAAYHFYRSVVAQGPYGLAALWLLHHPEQAREALDWTVQNRNLLSEKASWEHSLVGLLQGLSEADRGFVGVKVAELLSGLGIPHADEALDRVRRAQPNDDAGPTGEPW